MESLGYPERVRSVGTSVAAKWAFQAGYKYDCGCIRLDQVSSASKVVEFVGTCTVSFQNKINLTHWFI